MADDRPTGCCDPLEDSALLLVDVQNDFCPGGALPVQDGHLVVAVLNDYVARFERAGRPIVFSRDWHPPRMTHFREYGGPWPVHCVQDTEGAELHSALDPARLDVIIDKGQNPQTEGYSGFDETRLEELLRERGIERVTIVGLATDYCVKNTALDALRHGFEVTVDRAGVRGVEVNPGDSERALDELHAAGATVS